MLQVEQSGMKATPDDINQLQKSTKFLLAEDVKKLFIEHAGDILLDNELPGEEGYGISEVLTPSSAIRLSHEIDGFPKDALPIMECYGGDYICVRSGESGIYYFDHEQEGLIKLARDIDHLTNLLSYNIETHEVPVVVGEVWIDPTFKPEF